MSSFGGDDARALAAKPIVRERPHAALVMRESLHDI